MAAHICEPDARGATTVAPDAGPQDWRARRRLGWVRSGGRALAVRVDEPAGPAVGAVVVAPPAGREAVVGVRTTAALALCAARAGFTAFTLSWSGEGDSEDLGPHDDLVAVWAEDVASVTAAARDHVGDGRPVHVIGMRVGASLAAAHPPVDVTSVLAWEPVSGKSFLNHHRLIRMESIPVPVTAEGTELEGVRYSEAQARSLAALRAPRGRGVLKEEDRRAALRIFLGAPFFAHVPVDSVHRVVDGLGRGPEGHLAPWAGETTAVMRGPDGTPVQETFTTIGSLPAVVTTAVGVTPRTGALFTAMGSEIKAGPGRIWATTARSLAARGVLSVRADRSFIGDDTGPDQVTEPRPYADRSVSDVAAVARYVRERGLPVTGVGLCAGAWALLRAASEGHFDGVVAVNPVHWNPREDVYDEDFYRHYHGGGSGDSDAPGPTSTTTRPDTAPARWVTHLAARRRTVLAALSKEVAIRFPRLRSALRPDVPLDLASMLLRPLRAPLEVTLAFGEEEYRIFCGKGGRRAVAAARRRGLDVSVSTDAVFDHSLFSCAGRERTQRLLEERLGAPGRDLA